MARPFFLAHTFTADGYRSLASLAGTEGQAPALTEGVVQAQSNGATLRFGDETTPAATDPGVALAVGAALGIGPVKDPAAAWPLSRVWVRNTTPGSNALVVVAGVVG